MKRAREGNEENQPPEQNLESTCKGFVLLYIIDISVKKRVRFISQPPSVHYFDKREAPSDTLVNVVRAKSDSAPSPVPVEETTLEFEGEESTSLFSLDQVRKLVY
jgi:hypothetical protein